MTHSAHHLLLIPPYLAKPKVTHLAYPLIHHHVLQIQISMNYIMTPQSHHPLSYLIQIIHHLIHAHLLITYISLQITISTIVHHYIHIITSLYYIHQIHYIIASLLG